MGKRAQRADALTANVASKGWDLIIAQSKFVMVKVRDTPAGFATLAYGDDGQMYWGHYDLTFSQAFRDMQRRMASEAAVA